MQPKKNLTFKYGLLQGAYWIAYCSCLSFAMEFLLDKGFSAAVTGVILAVACVLTTLAQPALAAFAERNGKPGLRTIVIGGALIAAACSLAMGLMSGPVVALLFCVMSMIIQGLYPFINSIAFAFINNGEKLNFGVGRSTGSVLFACFSSITGMFVVKMGGNALAFLNLGTLALVVASCWAMGAPSETVRTRAVAEPTPLIEFFGRYRRFCVLLVGLMLSFFQQSIINTYLTQIFEGVGGNSVDKGIGLAIAAVCEMPTLVCFALLVKKFSIRSLMRFAAIFLTVKAVWFTVATSVVSLYFAHGLQMLGYAIYIPASVYYANHLMAERDRVKGVTLMNIPLTLGGVFGSLLGGWLLSLIGLNGLLWLSTAVSAVGCVIIFFSLEDV